MSAPGVPASQSIPFVRGAWLLANVLAYRRDPLGFVRETARLGDLVKIRMGPYQFYLVASPELVHQVLVERQHRYDKQTLGFAALRLVLGDGLLTSEGTFWKRQRRIANPAFLRERVATFASLMLEETEALLERWRPAAEHGGTVDVAHEMMDLALRVVCRALLGAEVSEEVEQVDRALSELLGLAMRRITAVIRLPLGVPSPANRRFRRALGTLDRIVYGVIEKRRRHGGGDDLLSRLMEARDEETGERMDDRQLRDEVMTMFLAGHETTANALTWTWYLLSQNPEPRRRLDEELARVLGGRPPALQDLGALPYTAMVLKESMRLFPPAWMISRRAVAEDELGGCRLPAGARVMVSPYVLHHHPALWERPESFEPERFAPGQEEGRPRLAYFPFGAGPRLCVGRDFALQEAQLVLATMAQRYHLELVPGHPVVPEPRITLRPKHGMRMIVRGRSSRSW